MRPKPDGDIIAYGGGLFRIVRTPEELEAALLAEDFGALLSLEREHYEIRENRLYRRTPDGTEEFFPYTGTKHARQYYADEAEYGGKLHDRLCEFVFEEGTFLPGKSEVFVSDERFITPFVWSEGAEEREGIFGTADGRKMFFLNPVGGVMQYEELLARYVAYGNTRTLDKDWVDRMKGMRHPVFRMEVMRSDGDGRFSRKVYDLVLLAVRLLDAERLGWLIDTVPADDPDRAAELSAEFSAALAGENPGDAEGVREILRKFFEPSEGGFTG